MQVQSSLMGMPFYDLCTVISVITSGIVVPWSLLLSFEVRETREIKLVGGQTLDNRVVDQSTPTMIQIKNVYNTCC